MHLNTRDKINPDWLEWIEETQNQQPSSRQGMNGEDKLGADFFAPLKLSGSSSLTCSEA